MKFAKRDRREVDINLTPLIDVVFLLLIFFMVSTTFIKGQPLSINLPKVAPGAAVTTVEKDIEIVIASDGSYSVNGVQLADKLPGTLRAAILDVSAEAGAVAIAADAATQHQSVVTAMDILRQLGLDRLSITTLASGSAHASTASDSEQKEQAQ